MIVLWKCLGNKKCDDNHLTSFKHRRRFPLRFLNNTRARKRNKKVKKIPFRKIKKRFNPHNVYIAENQFDLATCSCFAYKKKKKEEAMKNQRQFSHVKLLMQLVAFSLSSSLYPFLIVLYKKNVSYIQLSHVSITNSANAIKTIKNHQQYYYINKR